MRTFWESGDSFGGVNANRFENFDILGKQGHFWRVRTNCKKGKFVEKFFELMDTSFALLSISKVQLNVFVCL